MDIVIDVPDGKSGEWEVETFKVSDDEAKMFNLRARFQNGCREIKAGSYKKLTRNGSTVMSNTQSEILDHYYFIHKAMCGGHVLINGLGLGVALKAILESDKVESVTVIEKSKDVIALVGDHYSGDKRVNIVNADAFTFKPPKGQRYSAVWHDIWDDICGSNLPEMTKLHRKYGRRTDWQDSWCKDLCRRNQ